MMDGFKDWCAGEGPGIEMLTLQDLQNQTYPNRCWSTIIFFTTTNRFRIQDVFSETNEIVSQRKRCENKISRVGNALYTKSDDNPKAKFW